MIAKVYPAAKRYMEYMAKKERKGGLIEHGLGDWGRDIAFGNHQANIETAVYYRCLRCCEMMARHLSLTGEADAFGSKAGKVYDTYNKTLLVADDPEHPQVYYTSLDNYPRRDRTAVSQAIALQFGMVPSAHIADIQASFLEDVADGKIRAGEIGLRFLFNTLHDVNRPDLVLRMARQEEHPSYMRFIRRGETTLNEFWQDECRSKCHDMLGTIYEWFYAAILGLRSTSEAYKTFLVDPPYRSEFEDVQGQMECPYGMIRIQYSKNSSTGNVIIKLDVPMSTTATLRLPQLQDNDLNVDKNGRHIPVGQDCDEISIRHGSYRVAFTLAD